MSASAINPTLDIIDSILQEASFHHLLSALQAAVMVDILKGSGPFTLFAPTDNAFSKLSTSTIQELEKPANREKLIGILEQHIVRGRHDTGDLETRSVLQAVNGSALTVAADARGAVVDGAHLLGQDIQCTNGVIHAIDRVLEPAS